MGKNKKTEKEGVIFEKNEEQENIQGQLDALLFASGEPVAISKLAQFLKIKKDECKEQLVGLASFYEESGRGISLVSSRDEVQMVSAPAFGKEVASFLNKELSEDISKSSLEVLAIVAYRSPISRAEVEYIRGVNCSFALRNLAMRGLVERKDNPSDSRAYLYEPSLDFLKSLGISKIEELDEYEKLSKKQSA